METIPEVEIDQHENPPVEAAAEPPVPTDTEQLEKQLQLIQLCFYEYEFGVTVDDDDDANGASASASASALGGVVPFDPLSFIDGKVSHGVSLDDLSRDLTFFIDHVQQRINHCVNTDLHTAFVNVSGHLVGMQEELQYVQRPLTSSLTRAAAAREQLEAASEVIDKKIQQARDAEKERVFDATFLKALLVYEHLADTMDSLSAEVSSVCPSSRAQKPSARSVSPDRTASTNASTSSTHLSPQVCDGLLERVEAAALSSRQLAATEALLPSIPQREKELAELRGYVKAANTAAYDILQQVLRTVCQEYMDAPHAVNARPLQRIMGIYNVIGAHAQFCEAFREGILQPILESLLSWKAATQARQNTDETVRLLGLLKMELGQLIVKVFPLIRESFPDTPLFPVSTILWPTTCEVLIKKLVSLYEVGNGDAFHKKYTAAYRLLALAESSCDTAEELQALRQSPDVAFWNHKWNTDVYAALRIGETERAMEPALTALRDAKPVPDILLPVTVTTRGCRVHILAIFKEQLDWLFSDGVVLRVCVPAFLRHVAVSMHQVAQAVMAYCTARQKATPSAAAAGGAGAGGGLDKQQITLLVQFVADMEHLGVYIAEELSARLETVLGSASSPPQGDAAANTAKVLTFVRDSVCKEYGVMAERMMTASVDEACSAALQNIKSVRSAYSHTRKPLPTAPSWYVGSVTEPIVRFTAAASEQQQLPAEVLAAMKGLIVDTVADQFAALARETLLAAKKTEESWEKLRKRKEALAADATPSPTTHSPTTDMGGAGSPVPPAEAVSDRDKMTLQLYLDAKAIEDAVGTPGRRSPSMEALFALLRRGEWLLGADIPEPPELED